MATYNSAPFTIAAARQPRSARDLAELTLGFAAISGRALAAHAPAIDFRPHRASRPADCRAVASPTLRELGLHWRGLVSSLWILPRRCGGTRCRHSGRPAAGTFHELYKADFAHVGGYVLWTIYQQFLLQDYFMPRLTRVLKTDAAIAFAAVLFAIAHLPNVLTAGDSGLGSHLVRPVPPLPQH